jgi:hypothetical protein
MSDSWAQKYKVTRVLDSALESVLGGSSCSSLLDCFVEEGSSLIATKFVSRYQSESI